MARADATRGHLSVLAIDIGFLRGVGRGQPTRGDAVNEPIENALSRRNFLGGAVMLGGATILTGCGSPAVEETPDAGTSRPPMEQEPGELSILEWGGYEAGGTPQQAFCSAWSSLLM